MVLGEMWSWWGADTNWQADTTEAAEAVLDNANIEDDTAGTTPTHHCIAVATRDRDDDLTLMQRLLW